MLNMFCCEPEDRDNSERFLKTRMCAKVKCLRWPLFHESRPIRSKFL